MTKKKKSGSMGLHALDSLLTFSAMEKVRAFRLEDKRNFQPLIRYY